MIDQRELVVGEDVGRVMHRIVRFVAGPVGAQIGHDAPIACFGELDGGAIGYPVRCGITDIAMDEKQRPAFTQLAPGEACAVPRLEMPDVAHSGISTPASFHMLTTQPQRSAPAQSAIAGQRGGIDPGLMQGFDREMVFGAEHRWVVKAPDRQIHFLTALAKAKA